MSKVDNKIVGNSKQLVEMPKKDKISRKLKNLVEMFEIDQNR
jgi:hypothetical protein